MRTSYKQLLSRLQRLALVREFNGIILKKHIKKIPLKQAWQCFKDSRTFVVGIFESFFMTVFITFYAFLSFLKYNFQVSGKREII